MQITLIVITVICAFNWIKWKVATMSLIYYIEKNQYKTPDENDMKECTGFIVKNLFKDLMHVS